ncbi:hypothetical protein HQ585_01525 [candidate division KSB1 bacterium]|nr:hypothetical protein [candidate division KSB1 bacterium]
MKGKTRNSFLTGFALFVLFMAIAMNSSFAQDDAAMKRLLIEQTNFIQIPGPNPILTPDPKGNWDDKVTEAADGFEHLGVYYFYYHAVGTVTESYQLGVASAPSPLGPFNKHGENPILVVGPEGSWDSKHVACAMIVRSEKENEEIFYMWYSGCDTTYQWEIGLATAPHPLGPWTKYEGNPVLEDFGYVGGVLQVDGKWRIYSAYPINTPWSKLEEVKSRSLEYHSDYSPLAVAIGDKPEGPYVKYEGNPLMVRGKTGDWDDGGISEAEVLYNNGMYHMYYGAVRTYGPRIEGVGYAYSFDGFEWFKYGKNPVAAYQAEPNAAAFAEIHAIIEPPFVYLYHTLRPESRDGKMYSWEEDLGVQVLVTQRPFNFEMPVLNIDNLGGGKRSAIEKCPPISIGNVEGVSITAECTYSKKSNKPIRVHIFSSPDGLKYDTTDLVWFDNDFIPGKTAQKTFDVNTNARYIKVIIENLDGSQAVSDIIITASLSG